MREVRINNLGKIHWTETDKLMRDLQKSRIAGEIEDTIF